MFLRQVVRNYVNIKRSTVTRARRRFTRRSCREFRRLRARKQATRRRRVRRQNARKRALPRIARFALIFRQAGYKVSRLRHLIR
jgi:hypothetical protein